ncbi:MAG: hypothetical protein WCG04_04860 [Alphaproteobacteria bacterium]
MRKLSYTILAAVAIQLCASAHAATSAPAAPTVAGAASTANDLSAGYAQALAQKQQEQTTKAQSVFGGFGTGLACRAIASASCGIGVATITSDIGHMEKCKDHRADATKCFAAICAAIKGKPDYAAKLTDYYKNIACGAAAPAAAPVPAAK